MWKSNGTFYESAQNYKSPEGTYTISAHGVLKTLYIKGPTGEYLSGKNVWYIIKAEYKKGGYKKIRVAACEAGKANDGERSFASDLAAWSKEPVEATPYLVGYPRDGKIFVGRELRGSGGRKTIPFIGVTWRDY